MYSVTYNGLTSIHTVQVNLLEHCETGRRVVVGNAHLYWDPKVPHAKTLQASLACEALARFAGLSSKPAAVVLAGDLNSIPGVQPEFHDQVPY